jgi:hypothetical protein
MANERDMNGPDDALAGELSALFARTDPVPSVVADAARAAIEFRDLDAQMAELLRDSALEDKELAGVRGVGDRLLSFAFGDRFLEVDVAGSGERRELSGYLVPAQAGTLVAQGPEGMIEATVDERGRFRVARVPRGPIRLWVRAADAPVFHTPWLAL